MKVSLSTDALTTVKADLLAIGVTGSPLRDASVKSCDSRSRGKLREQIKLERFDGAPGQTLRAPGSGVGAKQILLVGLDPKATPEARATKFASAAARAGASYGSIAIVAPDESAETIRALSTGATLGAYRFTRYLTGARLPKGSLSTAKILVKDKKAVAGLRASTDAGAALAECVNHARDLVNAPPNDLHPTALADFAKEQCKLAGVDCKVWDKKGIEKLGMHLFLAVNRGSAQPPRLIHMTYKPKDAPTDGPRIVFVGKGLTFDAGGLCIKPPKAMLDMKCDMAGAAATIGIVLAAARLGLPIEVHGIIGSTENMLGADAYRPGDVFPSLDGKTVEIINTDAEGRLVLADCLAYARTLEPTYLIDHATLTGACIVALGPWTSGLFTDDEELASHYEAASQTAGESFWRLPLDNELFETLKSDIADLQHTGDRGGGSITAALFLREFVGESKWMHLDIAGPAFMERPHGVMPKGGTGFGVMTGVRFLERLVAPAE
ncbi:MAG: leucyl aminopeptidase [Sandaracinaceae bacterium]